jgi:hypothetical protein
LLEYGGAFTEQPSSPETLITVQLVPISSEHTFIDHLSPEQRYHYHTDFFGAGIMIRYGAMFKDNGSPSK